MEKAIKDFIYYERFAQNKSENTLKSYKKDLYQLREFLDGSENIVDWNNVEEVHLRAFVYSLNSEDKISKRSINRKLSTMRSFFKYLKIHNLIKKNPSLFLTSPNFKIKLPEVLNTEEIKKLREAIDTKKINGIRDRFIIELLYSSGIRANELLKLSEKLFDLEKRELKIFSSNKNERTVFFSETAKEWYLKYRQAKIEKYGEEYNRDILLMNSRGTRLGDRSLRRLIERYAQKAGIEKEVSPHTFRHSFALYMLKHGMDIYYLQELMGHISIESTKIYTEYDENLKIDYDKTYFYKND
jgi:integrase/recombinase XerD